VNPCYWLQIGISAFAFFLLSNNWRKKGTYHLRRSKPFNKPDEYSDKQNTRAGNTSNSCGIEIRAKWRSIHSRGVLSRLGQIGHHSGVRRTQFTPRDRGGCDASRDEVASGWEETVQADETDEQLQHAPSSTEGSLAPDSNVAVARSPHSLKQPWPSVWTDEGMLEGRQLRTRFECECGKTLTSTETRFAEHLDRSRDTD
jgi:hypothetical protein